MSIFSRVVFITVFFNASVFAQFSKNLSYKVGLGALTQYTGEVQVTRSGEKNGIDPKTFLKLSGDFNFKKNFSLLVDLGIGIPFHNEDPNISIMHDFFDVAIGYRPINWFSAKLGIGYFFTTIWGSGGTQTLNNGTSQDDFTVPSGPSFARNLISTIGLKFFVPHGITINFDTYFFNFFSKRNGAKTYLLSVDYELEKVIWD